MYRRSKRVFDVVVAIAVGVVFVPIEAIVVLLLWLAQRRVLFRQLSLGLHGKPFTLYKFCSMIDAWDKNGVLLSDEQRLTRIGSLVRSSSLDELLEVSRTTLKAASL
jgi:lipopolysaccharide/colanic/teichoic acid biosynthesis glycosyltransferase